MAGRIGLKLGGMVEGMCENVLAKEFFGSVEVDRGQVGGPQRPLLGHGTAKMPQIWHDGTSRQEITNEVVGQHVEGGQGQDGGPQVPLLGREIEMKSPN